MDDTSRTRVEFPVGTTGTYVTVKEPTDGQRLVLLLSGSLQNKDQHAQSSAVLRMFSVLEVLTGDQWDSVIEEGLVTERFTIRDVIGIIEQMVKFNWADTHKEEDPGPLPPAVNGVQPLAAELEKEMTQEEAPAPRVVGA